MDEGFDLLRGVITRRQIISPDIRSRANKISPIIPLEDISPACNLRYYPVPGEMTSDTTLKQRKVKFSCGRSLQILNVVVCVLSEAAEPRIIINALHIGV